MDADLKYLFICLINYFFWGISFYFFLNYWWEEAVDFYYACRLYILVAGTLFQWLMDGGREYYIVSYRRRGDEEGTFRVIEFPPIR